MPQPYLSIAVKKGAGKIVRSGLERLRTKIALISRKRLYENAKEIKAEMSVEGGDVVRPIRWDSDKQRKAFFATDGFGGGIPTQRSGKTPAGWKIIKTDAGYDITNPLAHAKYLYGTARSKKKISSIHKGTYPVFAEVWERIVAKLPKSVLKAIKTTARQEGYKIK